MKRGVCICIEKDNVLTNQNISFISKHNQNIYLIKILISFQENVLKLSIDHYSILVLLKQYSHNKRRSIFEFDFKIVIYEEQRLAADN